MEFATGVVLLLARYPEPVCIPELDCDEKYDDVSVE
jgi:hypothetical protein